MGTRTGGFPVGFRRGWSPWQKDTAGMTAWARQAGFDHVDVGTAADANALKAAGLGIGSVDLLQMGEVNSPDAGKRKDVVASNVAHMKECAAAGTKVFFTIVSGDPAKSVLDNYKTAVEALGALGQVAADTKTTIAIEGWPGGDPHMAHLCCNPETYRAIIKDTNPKTVGVNYDPSHLIRMGIDHIRFLREFVNSVYHVHAKDTEIFPEAIYEVGHYQGSAFEKPYRFGKHTWRYTIPGHGETRWTEVFKILKANNYNGKVSVELEDGNFNGSEDGEKAGLTHSLAFLKGV